MAQSKNSFDLPDTLEESHGHTLKTSGLDLSELPSNKGDGVDPCPKLDPDRKGQGVWISGSINCVTFPDTKSIQTGKKKTTAIYHLRHFFVSFKSILIQKTSDEHNFKMKGTSFD